MHVDIEPGQLMAEKRRPPMWGGEAHRLFGDCARCGRCRWWDNRARKVLGGMKPRGPVATCAHCGHPLWALAERTVQPGSLLS